MRSIQSNNILKAGAYALVSAALLSACVPKADIANVSEPQVQNWKDRPADADILYKQRWDKISAGAGRIDYDFLAAVPGAAEGDWRIPETSGGAISAESIATVNEYAEKNNSTALLIWHDGKLLSETYFGGNNAATKLPSKSLSKPMTAIAVGRAIQLGYISSLDQKLGEIIAEWRDSDKGKPTIRHLLTMQAGLLEQKFSFDPESPYSRGYLDPYHGRYILDEYPFTDAPGARYAYSNASGDLIAILIERATGRKYAEFVGNEILKPVGAPGGDVWLNREGGLAHSGCCMLLPTQSWLKLAILLMNDGMVGDKRLLPGGFVTDMRTGTAQNPHYGLGLWLGSPYKKRRGFLGPLSDAPKVLHTAPYLADDVFLFDGNGHQLAYIVPSKKTVIVRMGGSPKGKAEWDNSFILNTVLSGLKD